MKYKITLIIVLFSFFVNAQVPGYLGKRLSVGYSNYFSPSFLNASANTQNQTLGINTAHCVNLEYAIKLRTNFCAGLQFSKTGINGTSGFNYEYVDSNNGYVTQGTAYYYPSSKLPVQLKTTNVSIGFKFFGQGFIAPVGKYKKLEFILLLDKVTYDKTAFYSSNGYAAEYRIAAFGKGEYDFKSFAIAYTVGRQRILFNTLIIDSGFRLGICPNAMLAYVKNDLNDGVFTGIEDQLKQKVNYRIFAAQLVNFHIGIGFLAF